MRIIEEHYFRGDSFCTVNPEIVVISADNKASTINWCKNISNPYAIPLILDATIIKTEKNLKNILSVVEMSHYHPVKILHLLQGSAIGERVDAHNEAVDVIVSEIYKNHESLLLAKTKHKDLSYYSKGLFDAGEPPRINTTFESPMLLARRCLDLAYKTLHPGIAIVFLSSSAPAWDIEKKKALIVNILKGLPIGTLYTNEATWSSLQEPKYTNILWDGRERIRAINDFLFGEFSVSTELGDLYYQQACGYFNTRLTRYTATICHTSFENVAEITKFRKLLHQ